VEAKWVATKEPSHQSSFGGKKTPAGVATLRPPLNRIFVKPCSGARRATAIQQHAHRFACLIGRPRWPVSSRCRVRGLAVLHGIQQHAHRFACRIGRLQSLAHEPGAATRLDRSVLRGPRWPVSSRCRIRGLVSRPGLKLTHKESKDEKCGMIQRGIQAQARGGRGQREI
jgi:hypothetical protein